MDHWYNQNWFLAVISIVNVLIVTWTLRDLRQKNTFDIFTNIAQRMHGRFGASNTSGPLYHLMNEFGDINKRLSAGDAWHDNQLVERMLCLNSLSADQWKKNFDIIKPVVNTFSEVAFFSEIGTVSLRQFLSINHLSILREGWIVEPYIFHYMIEKNPGRWGMRALQLLQAARDYHDLNPIHGQNVFLLDSSGSNNTVTGFIWKTRRYGRFAEIFRRFQWVLGTLPKISERAKKRQKTQLEEVKLLYEHQKPPITPR